MTFKIGNTVGKQITLADLTAGLDATKDKKKIDRITQIFNKYNTNQTGTSYGALDLDEQVALMNDLHKADGSNKNGENDGNVSSRGIKKAEIVGEYKAYKDFMEAYQKAISGSDNTYNLTYKTDSVESITQIDATQAGEDATVKNSYVADSENIRKTSTTQKTAEGSETRNTKGLLTQQIIGKRQLNYHYSNNADKDSLPSVVIDRKNENQREVLKLQEDGTYLNPETNARYKLNWDMLPEQFFVDEQNRVTSETMGNKTFDYTYENNDKTPVTITENKGQETEKVYIKENDLYSSQNGDKKEYFKFDAKNSALIPTKAPKEKPPTIVQQARPQHQKKISMTQGWKNQRVNPDPAQTVRFYAMKKADEVLTELVNKNEQFKNANLNKEQLLADLIKNNPSVFNSEGIIYSDAIWDRLDFPTDLAKYKVQE